MSKLNGQQKENLKALGIIVKYNRLRKGLSLRELAAKAKMSHTLISNIEKGHISANMNTLNELFRVLQIEFYYDPIVSKEFNELYNKIMTHILNYEYYQARKLLDILEQKSDIYISSQLNRIAFFLLVQLMTLNSLEFAKKIPGTHVHISQLCSCY